MGKTYLSNAFSLQMLKGENLPAMVHVENFSARQAAEEIIPSVIDGGVISAVGHADTAAVLGVPMNRINVSLEKGDVLFVAQLVGGRLPEGTTKLPEGFSFKWLKVTLE